MHQNAVLRLTLSLNCRYALMGSSGCGKTTLISSLVGVGKLDCGDVKIFGEPLKNPQNSRIGFMPQEIALVGGFQIKEMFWFFGTIFGLSREEIEEKFKLLSTLLELPDGERLVKTCSGGQQRRISFAVSLIHDPDLLILDEPTVGVDPMLREKIWNHLVELTLTRNVTILLSTHYIEEARQSHQIGLMRNGVLIAQDSPQNILTSCDTDNMEEAFLQLSQKQEINIGNCVNLIDDFELQNESRPSQEGIEERSQEKKSPRVLSALLIKHFVEFTRNYR
jgi:ABC-type multidrug transport system ATPase subunit